MAALTEEIYGTIADIEGGISNDKNDIGNYIGGNKKGTFVPTKYGVTFDWWYKNIKNKTGVPKESEKNALIDEFNNSVKNSTDAKNIIKVGNGSFSSVAGSAELLSNKGFEDSSVVETGSIDDWNSRLKVTNAFSINELLRTNF